MTVITCGPRAKPMRCANCKGLGQLFCDGCDEPLCAPCSVSHRADLDFCPSCCREIFQQWCTTEEAKRYVNGQRDLRRNAFRAWVKNFASIRLEAMRSKASLEVESANNGTLNPPRRKTR